MKHIFTLTIALICTCCSSAQTDSLLQAAKKMSTSDTGLTKVYTKLAWAYFSSGDTASTLLYLKKSEALSMALKFDNGLMNAYSNIGMYYTSFGASDSAVAYFSLCLEKAKETNAVDVASKTCINIAGNYLGRANYAEAVRYYLEAMQYLDKINDPLKIAINYHCLGIAYYMLRNYPLSLKYYYRSKEVGEKMGKPDESGYNDNGIGVVYKEMGKYDSALHYLDKANAATEKKT